MIRFPLLLAELRGKVHPPQESLGRELFERRRAQVIRAHEGELRAGVDHADGRYKVKVAWDERGYGVSCSCGTEGLQICAHAWAAILTADEDGWFNGRGHDLAGKLRRTNEGAVDRSFPRLGMSATSPPASPPPDPTPRWKQALDRLATVQAQEPPRTPWPATRQIAYVVDRDETLLGKGLVVEVCTRDPKSDGELSRPKPAKIGRGAVVDIPDADDRFVLAMLTGGDRSNYGYYYGGDGAARYRLTEPLARAALPLMCRTGRCLLRTQGYGSEGYAVLAFGADERPWHLRVVVAREPDDADVYAVDGALERDGARRPLADAVLLTAGGMVFWRDTVELLDDHGAFHWVAYFREHGALRVPASQAAELAANLYASAPAGALCLPEELRLDESRPPLVPRLKVFPADAKYYYDDRLRAELTFDYAGERVDGRAAGRAVLQPERRRVVVRDTAGEAAAHARLHQLGFREGWDYRARRPMHILAPGKLGKAVSTLVAEGWQIDAAGVVYRQPGEFRVEVTSGIDWFELRAKVRFGEDLEVALPQLLAARRKGQGTIELPDGSLGVVPAEWLARHAPLAAMGKVTDDHVRFGRTQAGLLDALLGDNGAVACDEGFERAREALRGFDGLEPRSAPATFRGDLRAYQRDALGWFAFLRRFSFGGCLADDMGLGKTVQVLAMLLARKAEFGPTAPSAAKGRARRGRRASAEVSSPAILPPAPHVTPAPSLIVVPRSLVFNWLDEARRFAPDLKILDHSHASRERATHHFANSDVVLTTYGTLRNDAHYLREVEFDYVVLDEAQAIKNAASESAKAARLLKARHRLALSGTPVQNHLGDLWSLFEFLNPGMLGASSVLSGASVLSKGIDPATRDLLSRALRPLILRRTKQQVAKDLPEKLEQTLFCELDGAQRRQYDELRAHYRQSLLEKVKQEGLGKSRIEILEALLRLRQAACHPGLIDDAQAGAASAKLDMLLPRLAEIADEGHKALVFSQFTSFLDLVRQRLDREGIRYEYLDGQTRDRQGPVARFQSDYDCKVFLISLKAGGVGLNLTAADYVFLLDPWWNPAIEAQAIDRAHRIGQSRKVFACRLIAKDTVEEKVLELQQSKRELADAVITADESLLAKLKKQDLELLLS